MISIEFVDVSEPSIVLWSDDESGQVPRHGETVQLLGENLARSVVHVVWVYKPYGGLTGAVVHTYPMGGDGS